MTGTGDGQLNDLLIEVLRRISNRGAVHRRHQFFWRPAKYRSLPPAVLAGSMGLEWYLTGDGSAITSLATYLYQKHPKLRDRVSFDRTSSQILNILAKNAGDCFSFSFFTSARRTQTLSEALLPG